MHKLVILIETLSDPSSFEAVWPEFLHLVESMPGLKREATSHVDHILFGTFPYTLIHELYFDSMEATQAAMSSEEGRAAGKLLQSMTEGRVTLFFADHKEDVAENIARYRKQKPDE